MNVYLVTRNWYNEHGELETSTPVILESLTTAKAFCQRELDREQNLCSPPQYNVAEMQVNVTGVSERWMMNANKTWKRV